MRNGDLERGEGVKRRMFRNEEYCMRYGRGIWRKRNVREGRWGGGGIEEGS
jgi:hypothetical protein